MAENKVANVLKAKYKQKQSKNKSKAVRFKMFEDISSKTSSDVWKYMLKDQENGKAKCKKCYKVLECKSSTTSSLKNHLKTKHDITIKSSRKQSEIIPIDESDEESETPAKKSKPSSSKQTKLNFVVQEVLTVGKVIGQLVAVSGLSFNQVAKSDIIREGFKHHPDGINIPR